MAHALKMNELYSFDLNIRTWVITVKGHDGMTDKFLMQGSETKAKNYAKELGRDLFGTPRIKEIALNKV